MTKALEYIFIFFVFPGFLFSGIMGLFVGWIDRKVTARVQWRVGPPWYQNYVDILKLALYKETLIPEGVSKTMFLGMPIVAAASATLVSTIILMVNGMPKVGFVGDLIVIVYLLVIPSIAIILGGFISNNPYASVGASREMKLMLSYELPFILSLIVPVMRSGHTIRLSDILIYQHNSGPIIGSVSGAIAFLVMLLCVQAKLGLVPFDMAEAETEIIAGHCIEYSGKALAIFKIAKAIMLFTMPVFLMTLFFGGIGLSAAGLLRSLAYYLLIVVLMILIKNTNPRLRIDQALRFFWLPLTALAAVAIVLFHFGY